MGKTFGQATSEEDNSDSDDPHFGLFGDGEDEVWHSDYSDGHARDASSSPADPGDPTKTDWRDLPQAIPLEDREDDLDSLTSEEPESIPAEPPVVPRVANRFGSWVWLSPATSCLYSFGTVLVAIAVMAAISQS